MNSEITNNDKKCSFCNKTKLDVKYQTLDIKNYVLICNKCFCKIIFPESFINSKNNKNINENINKKI